MKKAYITRQPIGLIIATFIAIIAVVILRISTTPYAFELSASSNMPLGRLIDGVLPSGFVSNLIIAILYFINAATLASIVVKYSLSPTRTYLPIILYIITAIGCFIPVGAVSAVAASTLLTLSCVQMIAGFKRSYQFGKMFLSAFCLGIVPLLYAPAIALIPIGPITVALYRHTPREAVAAFAGLITPFLYCSLGWWFAGNDFTYIAKEIFRNTFTPYTTTSLATIFLNADITIQIYAGLYLCLMSYSIFILIIKLAGMRTRTRKIYIHFLWLLALCLLICFLPGNGAIILGMLAIPSSIILSSFFFRYSGKIAISIYLILIGIVFIINLTPYRWL